MPSLNDLWTAMHPKPPQITSMRVMTGGNRSRATIKNPTPTNKNKTYGTQKIITKTMKIRMNTRWNTNKRNATSLTRHRRTVMTKMRTIRTTTSDIGCTTPCR